MLQKINDRIQGWLAWIIISLITLTFTLFGVDYYLHSKSDHKAQAEVNNDIIDTHDFQMTYRRELRVQNSTSMTALEEKNLKRRILDDLILNLVMLNASKSNGFGVNQKQATAAILQIPQFQSEGHFSPDRYVHSLSNAFFTPQTFEREVQQGMLLNQQRFAWVGTEFTLPTELNRFLKLYHQTRSYSYLTLPVKSFMSKVSVSDDEVKEYYQNHKSEFLVPERVNIEYVLLSKTSLRNLVHVSDAEINKYYAENFKNSSSQTLSEVTSQIREQLIAEKVESKYTNLVEQLTDLSYQESESLESVAKTLKLHLEKSDLFTRNEGSSEITNNPLVRHAAFSHDVLKFGNNSAPIEVGDGVLVLRVKDHFSTAPKKLEDVQASIAKKLQYAKAELAANTLGEEIIKGDEQALNNIKHEAFAWKEVKKITRDSDKPAAKINELVFEMNKSKPISGIQLDNGDYVVVKLQDVFAGDLAHLDQELISSINQQMEANIGILNYDLYTHQLMSKATIVKH